MNTTGHAPWGLSLRDYGPAPGSHHHSHFQVLVGLRGALDLEVEGRGLRVAPGDGCVIAPGARHDFESFQGSQCLVLDTADSHWAVCPSRALQGTQLWPLAQFLALAVRQDQPLALLHGAALLREAWLHGRTPVHSCGVPAPMRGRPIDWVALQRWALQALHQPLTVADLAYRVHLSPVQFAARCRQEQGLSAMEWLRGLRLAQAQWLRGRGLPVAEVARRTGYRSPSALTAALRRERLTPTTSPSLRDDAPAPGDEAGV